MAEPKMLIGELFGINLPTAYKSKQSPDKTSNDGLMVGLELEIENLPDGQEHYQAVAGRFWNVDADGSLRPPGQAWEFISRPALIGHALAEMRLLFDKMRLTDDNYSDRCSVHVHTNVLDYSQEQIGNIVLVYPIFEGPIFQFVNHYKRKEEQGYCRDHNLYCVPWSDCRMNRNFVERFFNNPGEFIGDERRGRTPAWQKYTALNMLPMVRQGTIEWRHMHGTADMEKLTTWLNLIGAIMKFCKEQSFDDIVKTIKQLNDTSAYQQFFEAVLAGTLPYKDEYRTGMAEGVVNAKYSLINWEARKGKEGAAKKPQSLLYGFGDAQQVNVQIDDWLDAVVDEVVEDRPIVPEVALAQENQMRMEQLRPIPPAWQAPQILRGGDRNAIFQAQIQGAMEQLNNTRQAAGLPPFPARRDRDPAEVRARFNVAAGNPRRAR